MFQKEAKNIHLPINLGDGLVLRRSTLEDTEALCDFNKRIHKEEQIAPWTRDLMTHGLPQFHADDFTVVENTADRAIVSAVSLISQTWTYAGIPFKVGRPELVGTDAAFRGRGLIRKQFEVIHELSRQRGELVQGITGIPFYYRQFGYEMALCLDGWRKGGPGNIAQLKEGEEEPYVIRWAVENDLPLIGELYDYGCRRSLIATVWEQVDWRREMLVKDPNNINARRLAIIETRGGERVGFLAVPYNIWNDTQFATWFELKAGVSWLEVTPVVMRFLWKYGEENAKAADKKLNSIGFSLGMSHPAYDAAANRLPERNPIYAWYIRVPDLPAFLSVITPALEKNLAQSSYAGHTGELKISFYRSGLLLKLDHGRLTEISPWQPTPDEWGNAAFPGLTFLQLVFGYKSVDQLRDAFPDCWAHLGAHALLNALFPTKQSQLWPIS